MNDAVLHNPTATRPSATPSWITQALILEAKQVYGAKLHRIISDAEAVEIISNIANLMNALNNSRRQS